MRDVAEARGVDVFAPHSVNAVEARSQLAQIKPDLLVVCDYGQILSTETLAIAPLGGINLHGSLLPKYRGAAPVNWAIYHGESTSGVTVIQMSAKLDAGPNLVQRELAIGPDQTAVEVEEQLSHLGVEPVYEAIGLLSSWDGTSLLGEPQNAARISNAPRLKKEDGLVDWSRPATDIKNQVRAFKPWPNTFTYWKKPKGDLLRLILDKVSVVDGATDSSVAGQVIHSDGKQLHIATGRGTLRLDRVQPAGKRILDIDEFLRGYPISVGSQLGDDR